MKRDINLILKILEYFEEREEVSVDKDVVIPGYEMGVVAYHIRRMYEGGLLDAEAITSSTTESRLISVYPFGLTWQGHDFLDTIRHKDVKNKLLQRLGGSFSNVPFELIKELALSLGRNQLGL